LRVNRRFEFSSAKNEFGAPKRERALKAGKHFLSGGKG